jgi:nucleoside-diphosphate-sugar epimerase
MKTALILGGSGQIGQATARNLLADGWSLRLAQRHAAAPAGRSGRAGRVGGDGPRAPGAVASAVAGGVDALIDTVAFDERHARQLLDAEVDVGAFVVISTGSVCRDDAGRTLDEAARSGFPHFPVPITEDQPTTAPGPATYSTRKVALEQTLLQGARRPVTILRPFAIHGPGSTHPREWWFVKRILDGRRRIPLAWRGESRFHTSATVNIAELIRVVLAAPATRVLNAADPEALSVAEIGRIIADVYGVELDLVLLDGPPKDGVGGDALERSPAADRRHVARDGAGISACCDLPRRRSAPACRSAEALAAAGVPFAPYLAKRMFDYAAEDARLGEPSRSPPRSLA